MAYDIECRACRAQTWAVNVVDLFEHHTNAQGHFVCSKCMGIDAFIHQKSGALQEARDEVWERWNKGVIRIHYPKYPTYCPYIFLTADNEAGPITGLNFCYYKDTRSTGGELKHGHGLGGGPVLDIEDVFTILRHLLVEGVVTKKQVHEFADMI
jgi:hypothetical protein